VALRVGTVPGQVEVTCKAPLSGLESTFVVEVLGAIIALPSTEIIKPPNTESAALGTVDSAAAQDGVDASSGEAGGAVAQPSRDEALQPGAIEVSPAPAQAADDGAEAGASAAGPEETSQPAGADDSSGGTSTLRILLSRMVGASSSVAGEWKMVSALALAASLGHFVPRIMGRKER